MSTSVTVPTRAKGFRFDLSGFVEVYMDMCSQRNRPATKQARKKVGQLRDRLQKLACVDDYLRPGGRAELCATVLDGELRLMNASAYDHFQPLSEAELFEQIELEIR